MTDDGIKLLPEVTALTLDDLKAYALERAKSIARETPGEPEDAAWCDAEEWQAEAAQLAHAVVVLLSPRRVQCPTCRGHKKLCVDDYLELTVVCPGCRGLGDIEVTL